MVDTSQNPLLQILSIDGTAIRSISVTNNPELKTLNLSATQVSQLDVTKNPKLEELYISKSDRIGKDYPLRNIDVTHNPELKILFCQGNQLETLDVTKNPKLQSLYASTNNLTSIDLSNNPNLKELLIRTNKFNFNTLPRPIDKYPTYEYSNQQPIAVDLEYAENSTLDLTKEVWDGESLLKFDLFMIPESNPNQTVTLTEGTDYSISEGKVTFLKPQQDSVYVQILHEAFPMLYLKTTRFMVKTEEDFGKPSKQIEFTTSKVGESIELNFAASKNDAEIFIDFGDGIQKSYKLKTYINPYGGTIREQVSGSTISVYAPSGSEITMMKAVNIGMETLDVTKAKALTQLEINSNALKQIDLTYNKLLNRLVISNNQLETLDLSGISTTFSKQNLTWVEADQNKLTQVNLTGCTALQTLKVNNNQLIGIDLSPVAAKLQ